MFWGHPLDFLPPLQNECMNARPMQNLDSNITPKAHQYA
jgi:hypothetical protein